MLSGSAPLHVRVDDPLGVTRYDLYRATKQGVLQLRITLIATDEKGMNEAVGSLYEAVAGLEPLTKWELPESDSLVAAKEAPGLPRISG